MFAALIIDAAETNERRHLVHVAPHGFFHAAETMHQRVGRDRHQLALALRDAMEQLVKQREAL